MNFKKNQNHRALPLVPQTSGFVVNGGRGVWGHRLGVSSGIGGYIGHTVLLKSMYFIFYKSGVLYILTLPGPPLTENLFAAKQLQCPARGGSSSSSISPPPLS